MVIEMKKGANNKNKEKGQSLIELAMSLVVIIMLLGGIVDLGRALFTYLALRDAAEEGIVYGTAFPTQCDEIENRARYNYANGLLPATLDVEILIGTEACTSASPAEGQLMEITITQDFTISMPFIGAIIGQEIEMKARASGRILRS